MTLDLVRRGAASAIGVELSPMMIRLANSLAAESGLSERISFELADGAMANLKKSDIVILDTVLCCYPDASSRRQLDLRCRALLRNIDSG